MKFILAAIAVSFTLATIHEATAPPDSHASINFAYANAQAAAIQPMSWSKALNLESIAGFVLPTVRVQVIDADFDNFGMLPKEATPKRGARLGPSMRAYNTAPHLFRGKACADERATFEDNERRPA